jgi:laccase
MAMAISSLLRPWQLAMATLMVLIIQAQGITRHYDFNVCLSTPDS